ncbi:MAG TPA: hypothetical protein PLP27_06850 [Crocinitomicaceae bacterium]|nr:hypothetical protein [Crocinitomicaceae bacterium]
MKHFLFFGLLFIYTSSFSQTLKADISTDFKRRDFFLNIHGSFSIEKHQIGLGTGFGLQKAINQNSCLQHVFVDYNYCFFSTENVHLFASNYLAYSTMSLSRATKQRLHVIENLAGLSYEIGNKIRFKNAILGGLYSEFFTPKVTTFSVRKISIGYQFTIGLVYVL